MLDKYEAFIKLSRSPTVSFYQANSRSNGASVLIKKVKETLSWNDMLSNKHIQFAAKCKSAPKMIQILKNKGHFYFVYERPTGTSLSLYQYADKIAVPQFYLIFSELCDHIKQIRDLANDAYVMPEWVYLHRNGVRVAHFEPFLQKLQQEHDRGHVFGYQGRQNPQVDADSDDFLPQEVRKSLIFHMGIMAYHLLTGKRQEKAKSKQSYQQIIDKIREGAERHLLKATGDQKLASFICDMLSGNHFQVPTFVQVFNYMHVKAKALRPKQINHRTHLQVQIQKLNLIDPKSIKSTLKIGKRKCCITQHDLIAEKDEQLLQRVNRNKTSLMKMQKNKLYLPYLKSNRIQCQSNRHLMPSVKHSSKNSKKSNFFFKSFQQPCNY